MKSRYPHIRISRKTHDFLQQECAELDTPSLTELVELLVAIYQDNRDVFYELSGGVIGRPKQGLFSSQEK